MPDPSLLLYGRREPPPTVESLRAGPLRMLYQPVLGYVRGLRWNGREVLRGIYGAVRDRNWETIPGEFTESCRDIEADAFRVAFECHHRRKEIDFVWRGSITGTRDGCVSYEFDGEARSTFLRNRIGLCVLHPILECAGAAARQIRVDGRRVDGRFPDLIEPQVVGEGSFRELRSVAHEVEPRVWAEVEFEGEVFEMEDQRNWTDASFKTYGTPLSAPFPVEIKAGTRVRQGVRFRIVGARPPNRAGTVEVMDAPEAVVRPEPARAAPTRMPGVGLGMASHSGRLSDGQIARLRSLDLAHVRADLRFASTHWARDWTRALEEASRVGARVELALHLPRTGDVDASEIRRVLEAGRNAVVRVLALRDHEAATSVGTLDCIRRLTEGWNVPVGCGTDANFCELNREQALGRCAVRHADFVFWPMNPQVHASDDRTVLENLGAQAATVRTARAFAGGLPLVISPVTLRRRFNAVAIAEVSEGVPGELPPQVDPRQAGWFGAAWTLGSLAALAAAGVEAVTCYETTGWRGVMELEEGCPLPERFPSVAGAVFPLYHVFEEIRGFAGAEVLPMVGVPSDSMAILVLGVGIRQRVIIANLGPTACLVDLSEFPDLDRVRRWAIRDVQVEGTESERSRAPVVRRSPGRLQLSPFELISLWNSRGSPDS